MALLRVRALNVTYANGTRALRDVSFDAGRGELIAVVGRSGAGKSTLLRTIIGLQPIDTGQIVFDGTSLHTLNERQMTRIRRDIGFVWQEFNLVERLTVLTNVLCGRLGHNPWYLSAVRHFDRRHRAVAVRNLERVGLLHKAHDRADQCSGGEKQRVALARALTQEPKLLLADEPVASLDQELAEQLMADIAAAARDLGVLTLVNLHQIDLARRYCDRVIGIGHGRIVYDGPAGGMDQSVLHAIFAARPSPASAEGGP